MYYVCKVFYVLKPKNRDDEDVICFPIKVKQDSLFYREFMFVKNLNEVCDGFYVGKRVCFMIYDDDPYVIPVVWISQIYAWRTENVRVVKLGWVNVKEEEDGTEANRELTVTRFSAKITWYLYSQSFCCHLNLAVEDIPSCMTRQSIRIPSRVFREIFHIGIDECQKGYQKVYESVFLVLGFKEIENVISRLASGRFKNYAIVKSCVFQALSKRNNCEIVCHCLLCKFCFFLFDDVIREFCDRYDYDDAEELFATECDKCMHIDLQQLFSRVTCEGVSEWINLRKKPRRENSVWDF